MGQLLDKFRSAKAVASVDNPVADAATLEEISRVCLGRKIDPADFFDDSPERTAEREKVIAAVLLATDCQARQSVDTSEPIIPVAVADTAAPTPPVSAGDAIATPDDVPVEETEAGVSGDCGALRVFRSLVPGARFQFRPSHDMTVVSPVPATAVAGVTVAYNAEKAGLEIRFPAKPDAKVIANLKADGWRWSRHSSCWWRKDSTPARVSAWSITGVAVSGAPSQSADRSDVDYENNCRDRCGL